MAGPWRVRFVDWEVVEAFGNPHDPETRLKAQAALGYVPWPFYGGAGGEKRMGIIVHCPHCGVTGSIHLRPWDGMPVWTWNGDADAPTLSPSVYMPKDDHGFCGFHASITDGQIIDAGTPAH